MWESETEFPCSAVIMRTACPTAGSVAVQEVTHDGGDNQLPPAFLENVTPCSFQGVGLLSVADWTELGGAQPWASHKNQTNFQLVEPETRLLRDG